MGDSTTRNVFNPDFLSQLRAEDEPAWAGEAATAGPPAIHRLDEATWGVFPAGQSPALGDRPFATLTSYARAALVAAVKPGTGRDLLVRLDKSPDEHGFPLTAIDASEVGYLATFDPDLVHSLHVVECLLRSPAALALILDVAGEATLVAAGRAVYDRRKGDAAPG